MPHALEKMISPFLDTDTWQPGFSGLYWLKVLSIRVNVSAHDCAVHIWLISKPMKSIGRRRMIIFSECRDNWEKIKKHCPFHYYLISIPLNLLWINMKIITDHYFTAASWYLFCFN